MLSVLGGCSGGDDPAPGSSGSAGSGGATSTGGSGGDAGQSGGGSSGTGGSSGGQAGGGQAGGGGGTSTLVINEVYPSGDPADPDHPTDWVEILNLGDDPVQLDGYVITQGYDGSAMPGVDDQIPLTGVVEPGSYFLATTSNDAPGAMGSFGISTKEEERITLFDAAGGVVDETNTDGSDTNKFEDGISWARFPDGTGAFARRAQTREAPNAE